jgi:hypothetical protein
MALTPCRGLRLRPRSNIDTTTITRPIINIASTKPTQSPTAAEQIPLHLVEEFSTEASKKYIV